MTLRRRILVEKRATIVPLVAAIVINVAVYAFVVYPLGVKSAGAATRAERAAATLKAAETDLAAARALVAGTSRADEELATFYGKVLPSDMSSARRLTDGALPDLARKANVRFAERHTEVDENAAKSSGLGRMTSHVLLQGEYENFRQFIYDLESAPEFVIIDDVELSQAETGKPLTLTVQLSTYYRLGTNGN
jgi:Tfp pilus assembly protein PilO